MECRNTECTYGENTRIEVRSFQRILKETCRLEAAYFLFALSTGKIFAKIMIMT